MFMLCVLASLCIVIIIMLLLYLMVVFDKEYISFMKKLDELDES